MKVVNLTGFTVVAEFFENLLRKFKSVIKI